MNRVGTIDAGGLYGVSGVRGRHLPRIGTRGHEPSDPVFRREGRPCC